MSETVLIAEQDYTFLLDSSVGFYVGQNIPAFTLESGKHYKVLWNGEEFNLTAFNFSMQGFDGIGLGNESFMTGQSTEFTEPFSMYYLTANRVSVVATLYASASHRVALYLVEGTILKDRNGKDIQYYGVETLTVDTTEDKQQIYTRGVLLEGVSTDVDFSNGDMVLRLPDDYLAKEATIKKPNNLVPHNIRKGETIAGILGEAICDTEEVEVDLDFSHGDHIVTPTTADVLISKATIKKPAELVPENIKSGVAIAGIEGKFVVDGKEKAVDLDFENYILVNDSASMDDVLANPDNRGLCVKYVGTDGAYAEGSYYRIVFDDSKCAESTAEVASGTVLTSSIKCNVGDLIIAAFVIRSSLVSLSTGWSLISTSKTSSEINSADTYKQTLSFAYKYAESTTENITVTQATAARMYINMVSFSNATGFVDYGYQYQNNAEANIDTSSITVNRPSGEIVLWGATRCLWLSTSPYKTWVVSNDSRTIQLGSSTQSRLLLAIDTSDDETVTLSNFSTSTTDATICGALVIEFSSMPLTLKEVDVPISNRQFIDADEGTVMTRVIVNKPSQLRPENIAEGVDIGGVIGTLAKAERTFGNLKYIIPIQQTISKVNTYQLSTGSLTFKRTTTERIHVILYPPQSSTPSGRYWMHSVCYGCNYFSSNNYTMLYAHAASTFFNSSSSHSGTSNVQSKAGNLTEITGTIGFNTVSNSNNHDPSGTYYGFILVTDTAYTGPFTMLKENNYVISSAITVITS